MGFHVCEFCPHESVGISRFKKTSSGDVTLTFTNSHKWVMPDMILHYVADHNWMPPQEFINDVMNGELADSGRIQTRGMSIGGRVGYLAGSFEQGTAPDGFVERLEKLMQQAGSRGNRAQTKGLPTLR